MMATESQIKPKDFLKRLAAQLPSLIKPSNPVKTLKLGAIALSLAVTALGVSVALNPPTIQASDHDDGDIDIRSRALSLTDLYVFRERDQNPALGTDDLIFVMNTNPRSVARVQYYFSSSAQYEFRIARVGNNNAVPTGVPDVKLRVTFSEPDRNNRQRMTLTFVDRNGREVSTNRGTNGRPLLTTAITEASTPVINQTRVAGLPVTVFAGLREDPFYFDVEQFFRVRAGLLGTGPSVGFKSPSTARDFAAGYNVNTIALRVPRRLVQGQTRNTTFDVWLSLLVPDPRTNRFVQTEQLARPAVNEGLVISQSTYAQYNRVMPTRNARELAPIAREAKRTLLALGNSDARANALIGAFVPDVMRIDTTGPSGYANALNTAGSPIRGRLLLDDVIDITLTVLTNGAVTSDNVSYVGEPNNPAQGHKQLQGTFPYLALPN
jgi:Domain of unknown function (DUF4331)